MVFNLEEFLKAPDARVIVNLKKDELVELVTKFHLNIKHSARKVEIWNAVVHHLSEQEVLDGSALSIVVENVKIENRNFERERIEFEREKNA